MAQTQQHGGTQQRPTSAPTSAKKPRKPNPEKDAALAAEKIVKTDSDEIKATKRRAKFLRLGSVRVTKALATIRLIGNLSGSSYGYTEADIKAIDAALDTVIKETFAKFQPRKAGEKSKPTFQFAPSPA